MKLLVCTILIISAGFQSSFKQNQLKHSRVEAAYEEKEKIVSNYLEAFDIELEKIQIYLRAFKSEQVLEVWAKNKEDVKLQLVKEYAICQNSGILGPKRKQGDYQVPEGFYHINRFNPSSNFHLSLGINYPNKSDKILGDPDRPGGDIFIHGSCVTIGCLPMTDEVIKEIYVLCVESRNNGQNKIPITFFPAELTDEKLKEIRKENPFEASTIELWKELQTAYNLFNKTNKLPIISFLDNGRHLIIE